MGCCQICSDKRFKIVNNRKKPIQNYIITNSRQTTIKHEKINLLEEIEFPTINCCSNENIINASRISENKRQIIESNFINNSINLYYFVRGIEFLRNIKFCEIRNFKIISDEIYFKYH